MTTKCRAFIPPPATATATAIAIALSTVSCGWETEVAFAPAVETSRGAQLSASDSDGYLGRWRNAIPDVDFVSGQLVVGFRADTFGVRPDGSPPREAGELAALHAQLKAEAKRLAERRGYTVLDTSPVLRAALVSLPAGNSVVAEAERLHADVPSIAFAEPNGIQRAHLTEPTDPDYFDQAWRSWPGQAAGMTWVGMQRAWDLVPIDFTVRVAVIDSGYRFDDPDAHVHVSQTEDFDFVSPGLLYCAGLRPINRDYDGLGLDPDATDDMQVDCDPLTGVWSGAELSHGTAMAGAIAAGWSNGVGGTGMVGRVEDGPDLSSLTLIPIKALDVLREGHVYDLAQALVYAAGLPASNGRGGTVQMARADIVNMSFGDDTPSMIQQTAVWLADLQGVLMVGSAGNTPTGVLEWPAAFPQVVGVSGFDMPGVAPGNFGAHVDLAGPDEAMTRIYDYSGCPVFLFLPPLFPCDTSSGGTFDQRPEDGSSMATAVVSAIAALYKAHDDTLGSVALRALLLDNAADVGTPGWDLFFGYGLVQAAPGRGVPLVMNRGDMRVSAIDADTGVVAARQFLPPLASFPPGTAQLQIPGAKLTPLRHYYLIVDTDEDGDGRWGETGEAMGAFGGTPQVPLAVLYRGGAALTRPINFPLDFPSVEPVEPANDVAPGAGLLFVDHYVEATLDSAIDVDYFRVLVPHDGEYRIWTEGRNTILCNPLFGDYDVKLTLVGVFGGSADNHPLLDPFLPSENFCAEMTESLSAGEYFLKVEQSPDALTLAATGAKVIVHFDKEP
jgi:serine protease